MEGFFVLFFLTLFNWFTLARRNGGTAVWMGQLFNHGELPPAKLLLTFIEVAALKQMTSYCWQFLNHKEQPRLWNSNNLIIPQNFSPASPSKNLLWNKHSLLVFAKISSAAESTQPEIGKSNRNTVCIYPCWYYQVESVAMLMSGLIYIAEWDQSCPASHCLCWCENSGLH